MYEKVDLAYVVSFLFLMAKLPETQLCFMTACVAGSGMCVRSKTRDVLRRRDRAMRPSPKRAASLGFGVDKG